MGAAGGKGLAQIMRERAEDARIKIEALEAVWDAGERGAPLRALLEAGHRALLNLLPTVRRPTPREQAIHRELSDRYQRIARAEWMQRG